MSASGTPEVSVIVPTYGDTAALALCLEALAHQSLGAGRYEVIIGDNNLQPIPPALQVPGVAYVHCPTGFSYAARNAALATARAPVVAFTDADCIPARDWLEAGLRALNEQPGVSLLGGRVEVFGRSRSAAANYDRMLAFQQEASVRNGRYSVTANLFTYRRIFEEVGDFDPGRRSGGDRQWCHVAQRHGHRLVYADQVVVQHPARERLGEILYKSRRVASGSYDTARERYQGQPIRLWLYLAAAFRPRVREWFWILSGRLGRPDAVRRRDRWGVMIVRALMQYTVAATMLIEHRRRYRGAPDPQTLAR